MCVMAQSSNYSLKKGHQVSTLMITTPLYYNSKTDKHNTHIRLYSAPTATFLTQTTPNVETPKVDLNLKTHTSVMTATQNAW